MPEFSRTCNKKLVKAYVAMRGYASNADLARKLGVSRSLLCKLFNPIHPFKSESRICEIARTLGAPAEVLFPWEEQQ